MSCISQASLFIFTCRQMEVGTALLRSLKRLPSQQLLGLLPLPYFQNYFSEFLSLLPMSDHSLCAIEEMLPADCLLVCSLVSLSQMFSFVQSTERFLWTNPRVIIWPFMHTLQVSLAHCNTVLGCHGALSRGKSSSPSSFLFDNRSFLSFTMFFYFSCSFESELLVILSIQQGKSHTSKICFQRCV